MNIKSREEVGYLISPDDVRETQIRTLDSLLPKFFKENTIVTDSPIVARVVKVNLENRIEFHPLRSNARITVKDQYGNPWTTKYGATIISTEIDDSKFTVYYTNSSICG